MCKIYKIKEDPKRGKIVEPDTFVPFCWVGDLRSKNFYQNNKILQKQAISKYGILIEPLDTANDERLESGLKYLVKTTKTYRDLVTFFRQGGLEPWAQDNRDTILILPPIEQYLIQMKMPVKLCFIYICIFLLAEK